MKRILFFILLACLLSGSALSQSGGDSIVSNFRNEFEQFKQSVIDEQRQFISHNDSVFICFLEKTWIEKEVFKSEHKIEPKPIRQPVVKTKDTLTQELNYIHPKSFPIIKWDSTQATITKLNIPDESYMVAGTFDFYGNAEKIYYSPQIMPGLGMTVINNNIIARFYRSLAQNSTLWDFCLNFLKKSRQKYCLNDWGYYQLAKSLSESIFSLGNEQTLFCGYLLLKSGYNIKIGYENNVIYLLITSLQQLYNITYIKEAPQKLYILGSTGEKISNLYVNAGEYPGNTRPFSFDLQKYPKFGGGIAARTIHFKGHIIKLSFEKRDIDFLNTYPQCELGTFFHGGISENNLKILDTLFIPLFEGMKSDVEKVNLLLDFCQHALKYKTDGDQFGQERYLFAEETLYYPYSDCEDRSILLASFLKRYTELKSVALDFQGHVAMAVHFPEQVNGKYYMYNGVRYTACDPTFINSTSGMLIEDYLDQIPQFITY